VVLCPAGCFAALRFYQAGLRLKEEVEEDGGRWTRRTSLKQEVTVDIHLCALLRKEQVVCVRANYPGARARDGGECMIVVTTATACCPLKMGGAWRKVMQLRYDQLNQL